MNTDGIRVWLKESYFRQLLVWGKVLSNQAKEYDDVLFRHRPTENILNIRHSVSSSSSRRKEWLVGFGNPEEHIPMLTHSIAFGFEAIHDFLSLVCKFAVVFNSLVHGGVDRSDIKLPGFFRTDKLPQYSKRARGLVGVDPKDLATFATSLMSQTLSGYPFGPVTSPITETMIQPSEKTLSEVSMSPRTASTTTLTV